MFPPMIESYLSNQGPKQLQKQIQEFKVTFPNSARWDIFLTLKSVSQDKYGS